MILFPNGIQGLSDTKWSGVRGSAHRLVGVDYRSEPGAIKAHQKLAKISSTVVDELCKVALPLSDGSTLWFSSESGNVWREVSDTFTLLGTIEIDGYVMNLDTAEDTGNSKLYSAQVGLPYANCFSADGLTMYVLCNATVSGNNGEIFQYTLTTAWDVSTATYASKTYTGADIHGAGMFIKPDGTRYYICEDNGTSSVIEYQMSTPWDITTSSATGNTFSFSAQFARGYGIFFKPDGTKMYLWDGTNNRFREYTLGTAWNITTASYTNFFSPGVSIFTGGYITSDGKAILTISTDAFGTVYKYEMTTPWDITTCILRNSFVVGNNRTFALAGANDEYFYVSTQTTETVYQYQVTNAAADLNVTVLGAAEYAVPDGGVDEDEMTQYVYFATKNWLFRVAVSDVANITVLDETRGYLAEFLYGDDTYHPMKIANNRLFIGDKYTIMQVDEFGVITLETNLSVRQPEQITILDNFDVDLLVGTKLLNARSRILRWDTESETWYGEDTIYEGEVHAFLDEDNYTYAIVGDYGVLHYYDGEKLVKHIRIPGSYGPAARCKVNANAVGYFMGVPIFGVSNIEGNPVLQGVYSYGHYSKDYNITMDLSFPISTNEFSGVQIGAILVQGTDVYVAWKSGTAVGVDKLDWSTKYNGAYIETMVLNNAEDRSKLKSLDNVLADYIEMPANTDVVMAYSKNYGAFVNLESIPDSIYLQLRSKSTIPEIGAMTLRFTFTTSSNLTPKIENFHANFQGED